MFVSVSQTAVSVRCHITRNSCSLVKILTIVTVNLTTLRPKIVLLFAWLTVILVDPINSLCIRQICHGVTVTIGPKNMATCTNPVAIKSKNRNIRLYIYFNFMHNYYSFKIICNNSKSWRDSNFEDIFLLNEKIEYNILFYFLNYIIHLSIRGPNFNSPFISK